MINILYIQPYASHVGGVDTVLLQLVKGLDKNVYLPYVVLPAPSPYVEKYEEAGAIVLFCTLAVFGKPTDVLYYPRNMIKLIRSIAMLRDIVKRYGIDLIHSHKMEVLGGNIVGKLLGIPTLQTVHELPRKPLAAYKFVALLNHLFNDKIIVLCERSKVMFRWWKHRSGKLVKIYNGIELPAEPFPSDDALRKELGLDPSDKVAITVARLSPMKGIEYLLEAARSLKSTHPWLKIVIAGDVAFESERGYKAELLALKQKEQLDNVYFLGLRRDVPNLLRQADIFVLPSVYDIFPTVVLEAMSAGLPVVATDVGGVPEMVTERSGIVVPPRNAEALCLAIARMAESDAERFGREGRRLVETHFTRERYISQTTALYEELLGKDEKQNSA